MECREFAVVVVVGMTVEAVVSIAVAGVYMIRRGGWHSILGMPFS